MDPDANLAKQLVLAKGIVDYESHLGDQDDIEELAELVLALNEWVTNGGSIPKVYQSLDERYGDKAYQSLDERYGD